MLTGCLIFLPSNLATSNHPFPSMLPLNLAHLYGFQIQLLQKHPHSTLPPYLAHFFMYFRFSYLKSTLHLARNWTLWKLCCLLEGYSLVVSLKKQAKNNKNGLLILFCSLQQSLKLKPEGDIHINTLALMVEVSEVKPRQWSDIWAVNFSTRETFLQITLL